ncbi:hypothetical protein PHMEG_00030042 [Phytophthora megakarya]|uniref:Uncharacterized protein n=1 Tax=Phytophthora megakarya TaxID=4795 RepID=A0A225V0Q5_9STRA|nr:hypothetical protein PHMEG_00030042 [Phytophthora megakarya]
MACVKRQLKKCIINCASSLQLFWPIRSLPMLIRKTEEKDAAENIHREDEVRVRMAEFKTLKYVAHY